METNFPTSIKEQHTAFSLSFSIRPFGIVSHTVDETILNVANRTLHTHFATLLMLVSFG